MGLPLKRILLVILPLVIVIGITAVEYISRLINKNKQEQETQVIVRHETIYFRGEINKHGAEEIGKLIKRTVPTPKTLDIESGGGNYYDAIEIVKMLNENDLLLFVGKKAVCGSTCVYIFSYTRRHFADMDAIFYFHKGKKGELALHEHLSSAKIVEPPQNYETMMYQWAEQLSPKLKEFFQTCRIDPINDEKGIFILRREIDDVDNGSIKLNCEEMRNRDTEWALHFQRAE